MDTYTIEREGMSLSSLRLYCEKWGEQLRRQRAGVVLCELCVVVCVLCAVCCVLTPPPASSSVVACTTQEPCTSSSAKLPEHIQVHLNENGELFKYTCAHGCKLKTKQLEVAMQHVCQAARDS